MRNNSSYFKVGKVSYMPLQQLVVDKRLSKLLSYLVDKLGVREADIIRALKLARKAVIVYAGDDQIVVLVPSQRLHVMPREKVVSIVDLYSLLEGRYRIRSVKVGKLPTDQQWYRVTIQHEKIECTCPDTIYNRNPLCVHKLAAIILAYLCKHAQLRWLENSIKQLRKITREKKSSTLKSYVHSQT